MDMMELRRMVMAQMAKGAEIVKGTFTAINQSNNTFTLNFGKTFSKYIFLIKMTDESLATLKTSGQTGAKMYECLGRFPKYSIEDPPSNGNAYISYRIKPSDSTLSISSAENQSMTESSISFQCQSYNGGANILYVNHDYEYLIISLD